MRERAAWSLAALGALATAYGLVIRPWHLRWGTTEAERRRRLPGDDVVAHPTLAATRALTVAAPPEAIWPWIVQMGGHTRAGWYAYDRFDNAGRPSAREIVPALQSLRVGDVLLTDPRDGFTVAAIEPNRSLLLVIDRDEAQISSLFELDPLDHGRTRLICRLRAYFPPRPRPTLFALLFDAGDFLFMRKMMLGIRERAERAA